MPALKSKFIFNLLSHPPLPSRYPGPQKLLLMSQTLEDRGYISFSLTYTYVNPYHGSILQYKALLTALLTAVFYFTQIMKVPSQNHLQSLVTKLHILIYSRKVISWSINVCIIFKQIEMKNNKVKASSFNSWPLEKQSFIAPYDHCQFVTSLSNRDFGFVLFFSEILCSIAF